MQNNFKQGDIIVNTKTNTIDKFLIDSPYKDTILSSSNYRLATNIEKEIFESELARQNSESIDFSKASVICKVLPICKNTGKIFLESLDNGESYGCFLSEAESLGNNLLSDELRSIVNRKFHIFDDRSTKVTKS